MEDLYAILGCSVEATAEEIKQRYRVLARLSHPDSLHLGRAPACEQTFDKISYAYKILSDRDMRHEYDTRWHQQTLLQEFPVHDMVDFHELEPDELGEIFSYPCRCGDTFLLSRLDILLKFAYASCTSCSLCINISYSDKCEGVSHPS